MTDNINQAAREMVAKYLPYLLQRALRSHYHYMKNLVLERPVNSRDHKDRHAAGKMAMANIEHHLKVAAMLSDPVDQADPPKSDFQTYLNDPDVIAAAAVMDGFEDEEEMV